MTTVMSVEEAAMILMSMKNDRGGMCVSPSANSDVVSNSIPYRERAYDVRPPPRNATARQLERTPSSGSTLSFSTPPTPVSISPSQALEQDQSDHDRQRVVGSQDRKSVVNGRRKQQEFTLAKLDKAYETKVSKMERFCKNLACHFIEESEKATKKGVNIPKYAHLETYTAQLPPLPDIPPSADLSTIDNPKPGTANWDTPACKLAGQGLQHTEVELCRHLDLTFDKYRCIKSRLLFGFACIIEHNLRGGSGKLRSCHPFLDGHRNFRCMNLGLSQAQMLCKGFDANTTSRVCSTLQQWKWLPANDVFCIEGAVVGVIAEAEGRFPTPVRVHFMHEANLWDVKENVPRPNRMLILTDDLLNPGMGMRRQTTECSCGSQVQHDPVARYSLPQGKVTR